MKEKIKWAFLIIWIISIIVTIILYYDYVNKKQMDEKISELFDIRWYKTGIAYYEGEQLISENLKLISNSYMVLRDDYVEYYNAIDKKFDKYTYLYQNGTITINSGEYFIPKGKYRLVYTKEKMELIYEESSSRIIYYLETPKG